MAGYDELDQSAYWTLIRPESGDAKLHRAERLLRAAQAEVARLRAADRAPAVQIQNLYLGAFEVPLPQLDHMAEQLLSISQRISDMAHDLTAITAAVERTETVDGSILVLVQNLAQEVKDNANDPAALNALADRLVANAQKVADAVIANTPTDPAA